MESVKCQNCGLVDWEADQHCRRCGNSFANQKADGANNYAPTSPLKNLIFVLLFVLLVSAVAYKYWPTKFQGSLTASDSAHKSLNLPGEAIEVRQHLAPGKNTIVYFYADW
jgi:hypothetical protein